MTDEVLIQTEGRVGRIRLNRPRALHALNQAMCAAMLNALNAWADDTGIEAVVIDHAEGRGFCAGGDIRLMAESGAQDGAAARAFFHAEYRLNHRLFSYAKPVIAVMDGVTMGGGVGLAMPARFRVATENTRWAMPESGIGLFPDVGGGWYLSRLPGRVGQWLALTGAVLDGAECCALGLATHFVAAERLDEMNRRVVTEEVDAVLDTLAERQTREVVHRAEIDRLFGSDRLEDVLAALGQDGEDWAAQQLAILNTKSPQAMKVALKLLLDGRTMPTFEDEMRQEYAVVCHVVQRHDLIEGVRALVVDKDRSPRWQPDSAEGVSDHLIDQIFAPLPESEAWSPD